MTYSINWPITVRSAVSFRKLYLLWERGLGFNRIRQCQIPRIHTDIHSRVVPVIVRTHTNDTVSPSQLVLIVRQLDWALLLRVPFIYNSSLYITGCMVAHHCYNGNIRFLWEKLELWLPVKFKPLNRLSQNLSQLIKSTRECSFQVW